MKGHRLGFVSTRLIGTDGVSLETRKWNVVLERNGHTCFYFAGAADWPPERTCIVPEALFTHPDIQGIYQASFSKPTRDPDLTRCIHILKDHLKIQIYDFVRQYDIELLVVENALAIPMNIPLGLALTEFIAETGMPVIAHHHDFFWERKRFLSNCVWDYLNMTFPPHLPSILHVVINSSAANQLSLRTGISSLLIPNVMDFESPVAGPGAPLDQVRAALGVEKDEKLFLQPTRVVQRKGIEHAIELVRRIDGKSTLVVSHASGDEGDAYEQYIRGFAALLGVKANFVSDIIQDERGWTADGREVYTLSEVYACADIVSYPSNVEGFGNAFLEAIYYRRPIVVNMYSIYDTDIKPKGFRAIEFDGFITDETVREVQQVLADPHSALPMIEENFELAKLYYSYSVLERRLELLIAECLGEM